MFPAVSVVELPGGTFFASSSYISASRTGSHHVGGWSKILWIELIKFAWPVQTNNSCWDGYSILNQMITCGQSQMPVIEMSNKLLPFIVFKTCLKFWARLVGIGWFESKPRCLGDQAKAEERGWFRLKPGTRNELQSNIELIRLGLDDPSIITRKKKWTAWTADEIDALSLKIDLIKAFYVIVKDRRMPLTQVGLGNNRLPKLEIQCLEHRARSEERDVVARQKIKGFKY